jgi:hypothetical protein
LQQGFAMESLIKGGDPASLADLMGHESVETTKTFYAVLKQDDLRRKHDHFSAARWEGQSLADQQLETLSHPQAQRSQPKLERDR